MTFRMIDLFTEGRVVGLDDPSVWRLLMQLRLIDRNAKPSATIVEAKLHEEEPQWGWVRGKLTGVLVSGDVSFRALVRQSSGTVDWLFFLEPTNTSVTDLAAWLNRFGNGDEVQPSNNDPPSLGEVSSVVSMFSGFPDDDTHPGVGSAAKVLSFAVSTQPGTWWKAVCAQPEGIELNHVGIGAVVTVDGMTLDDRFTSFAGSPKADKADAVACPVSRIEVLAAGPTGMFETRFGGHSSVEDFKPISALPVLCIPNIKLFSFPISTQGTTSEGGHIPAELFVPLAASSIGPILRADVSFELPNTKSADISAEYSIWANTLLIAVPDIDTLLTCAGVKKLPEWLNKIVANAAVNAWMELAWSPSDDSPPALQGAGARIGPKSPIQLFNGVTFTPSVALELRSPGAGKPMEPSGTLMGTLIVDHGEGEVDASVRIPYGDYDVRFRASSTLLTALNVPCERLPQGIKDASLDVNAAGNLSDGSFVVSVELQGSKVDGGSPQPTGDAATALFQFNDGIFSGWGLRDVRFSTMRLAGADPLFAIAADLEVPGDCTFAITGGHDSRGWVVSGELTGDNPLDVKQILDNLLKGFKLPHEETPKISLAGVMFDANLSDGTFGIQGHATDVWTVAKILEVTVDHVAFRRTSQDTTADVGVTLNVGKSAIYLSASYLHEAQPAGGSGNVSRSEADDPIPAPDDPDEQTPSKTSWIFQGGTLPGQAIDIEDLIDFISNHTKAEQLDLFKGHPANEVSRSSPYVINALNTTIDTEKSSFIFDCSGHLEIETTVVETSLNVNGNFDQNASAAVAAVVNVDALTLAGDVKYDAANGTTLCVLYGASPTAGAPPSKPISVSDALQQIVGKVDGLPRLNVAVEKAAFLYHSPPDKSATPGGTPSSAPSSAALFDITLDVDFQLQPDETIKALVGTSASISIENLRFVAATADFPKQPEGVDPVSTSTDGPTASPSVDGEPAANGNNRAARPAIPSGLHLSFVLNLGGAPTTLGVPMAGASAPPAPGATDTGSVQPTGQSATPPNAPQTTWWEVQRHLGPLEVRKVGVRYSDEHLWLLLSAALHVGPLSLDADGFGIGFKPSVLVSGPGPEWNKLDIHCTLAGLGLKSQSGPVSFTASFLEITVQTGSGSLTQFAGEVSISLPTLSILGVGAYGQFSDGDPTLFLYAALSFAEGQGIGQPPLVITGFAAGFGVNYMVNIPTIDEVKDFPLVNMVMGANSPPAKADALAPGNSSVLDQLLSGKKPALSPHPGQFFGAIGLRFSLFEQIDAFALAIVQAGVDLRISILGLGSFRGPKEGEALCYIELALLIDIHPSEGVFRAEAQLTPNTWVLAPSCKLTGGFALVVWYSGYHKGDFILSVGGYHPRFEIPAHYPKVQPLGLNLQVDNVAIKGSSYFAITPSMMMAGGRLEITYSNSWLNASLTSYVDFLMQWEPLHYSLRAGVAIRVAADVGIFTIRVSLSVDLFLEGPPLHGVAHVDLSIITFSIAFGSTSAVPKLNSDWDVFTRTFIDRRQPEAEQGQPPKVPANVHQIRLVAGRQARQQTTPDDNLPLVVRGDELVFAVATAIPATAVGLGEVSDRDALPADDKQEYHQTKNCLQALTSSPEQPPRLGTRPTPPPPLGIRPMGVSDLSSTLLVAVEKMEANGTQNGANSTVDLKNWTLTEDRSSVPDAVWGVRETKGAAAVQPTPDVPTADVVRDCLVGVRSLVPGPPTRYGTGIRLTTSLSESSTDLSSNGSHGVAPSSTSSPLGQSDREAFLKSLRIAGFNSLPDELAEPREPALSAASS